MAIPSDLRCEREQLQKQGRGTRFWWLFRCLVSFLLLQGPLQPLIRRGEWWCLPLALGIWLGAVGLWWLAALAFESERRRIEMKLSRGFGGGWRGVLPMVILAFTFLFALRTPASMPQGALPILVFGAWIFVIEQTFAAKRASFDLLDAREQALRARLAPHFIFNTLNTLHAQIESDPRGAQATTERLAELFRQVISASDQSVIPLKQELAFVEAYLGIEQARLGERLVVRVDVPEELESALVPPLSLQVLVENAVKHGIAPLERGGEVRISAKREGADLAVEVSDPGTGIGAETGTGTALETLRARLAKPGDLTLARMDGRTVASFRWRQP
ncbi:MAG TPA: histidine kinase [Holophagaceae bacterium]|nr:histidine kinase [Holophagaceae bacterium]